MIDYVKQPHTALFVGPTDCGKTMKILDLIESFYKDHFENIVILCPTLQWNNTYLDRSWVWQDEHVFPIDPNGRLFDWIKELSSLLANEETLFVIDDIISDETLDKKRQPLLELAISGRHKRHYLWVLTQSYTAIPKNLRRQKKAVFIWYPNETNDFKLIDQETNVIPSDAFENVKNQLKNLEHGCLYIKLKYPRAFNIIN